MTAALDELRDRAKGDEDLRTTLAKARTAEDLVRIVQEAGIGLSLNDVRADGQLADAELEMVSGGIHYNQCTYAEICSGNF